MKKKILFYTPVSLLSGGGCERWLCDISNSLRQQFGHKIEIVSGNQGEKRWEKEYLRQQLQKTAYNQLNYLIFFGVLIPTPSIIIFLLKEFRQADVVYFIHGFMGQDLLMAFLKLATGKRVVVGHHSPIFYSSRIHNFYMRFISRFIMNVFDFNHVLNKTDKEFLISKWGIKNVYYIPIGIRVNNFLETKKIPHKHLTFLYVGRYTFQKGVYSELKAIEKFNNRFKNNQAEFIFVGSGDLNSKIQEFAKRNKNIVNLGFLPYSKLPSIYATSDVYLSFSQQEAFGLSLIEAWASGLPVLSTKTEGPRDTLKVNINGWFVDGGGVEEVFKGICILYESFLKQNDFLSRLEKSCRQTGEAFSINNVAKNMEQTFFN